MITDNFNFNFNRKWLIWGGIGFLVLLILFIIAIFIFWRGADTPISNETPNALTLTDDADRSIFIPEEANENLQPVTNTPPSEKNEAQEKLLLDIEYFRKEKFTINVKNIARTIDTPNVQYYKSGAGILFSVLTIYDTRGNIIFEQKISLPTAIVTEGPDIQGDPWNNLEKSESRLIIPIPENTTPKRITISGATGEHILERSFEYNNLDFENLDLNKPTSSIPNVLGIQSAQAQSNSAVKIVVINEIDTPTFHVDIITQKIRTMARTIEPWPEFFEEGKVTVVPMFTTEYLGCINETSNNGEYTSTSCPIYPVLNIVENEVPDWSTVIIVTTNDCSCGSVRYLGAGLGPVVAVGTNASATLLAHELGHSIGKMGDEYRYQFLSADASPPFPVNNCFETQPECEDETEDYPEAECSAGCNGGTNRTWRPASKLMHSPSESAFGPYEKCLMGKAIADILGEDFNCNGPSSPTPLVPSPSPTDNPADDGARYWGHGLR